MNEQQNMVVATTVAGLILVVVYLCPWRTASTGEIRWSPIYQPPLSYVRSYDGQHGTRGSSRIESEEAHVAVSILILEVLALLAAGGTLYLFFSDDGEDEESHPEASS
ncbi:hypothetical protein [Fodinibius sediminis]|uniref:Uncharacterized protein n=1 Tax=Fodinibius sediminis TaxID=1214077 RepID=A0A521EKK5_9BACT|nr:hypothetical protein [Fodinibius sediminis]SMO84422.1 hypothetical protein SAMN06265218_11711 [Fodinibius sediminis]